MELKKHEILVLWMVVTVFSCIALWSVKAEGQERRYPNKPIEVIVNFPAGGPVDAGARIIVNELTKELGVPISIQYKAGAGGVIGASYVTTAKPDGHTLLSTSAGPIIGAPTTEKEPPYDPLKDFTPIVYYTIQPNILTCHSSSKLTSFDALIKFAKENPGALTCATSGVGTTSHFVIEVLKIHGVNITHVPAKGAAPALTNLLGHHVDLALLMYPPILPHVKTGELRMLAVTNKMIQEPSIPTFKEKGFPEAEALGVWQGFFVRQIFQNRSSTNLPAPFER